LVKRLPKIYRIAGIVFIVFGILTLLWSTISVVFAPDHKDILNDIMIFLMGAIMTGTGFWYCFWKSGIIKGKMSELNIDDTAYSFSTALKIISHEITLWPRIHSLKAADILNIISAAVILCIGLLWLTILNDALVVMVSLFWIFIATLLLAGGIYTLLQRKWTLTFLSSIVAFIFFPLSGLPAFIFTVLSNMNWSKIKRAIIIGIAIIIFIPWVYLATIFLVLSFNN
jgi:hypothetical protein